MSNYTNLFKEILKDLWEHMLEENVYIRLQKGLKITKLPPVSHKEVKDEVKFSQSILNRLHQVPPSKLDYNDQLSYKIIEWEMEQQIELFEFFWLQFPICPYSSPMDIARRAFITYNFTQVRDLTDYLDLLRKYTPFLNDIMERIVEQQKRTILLPKDEIDLVVSFLKSFIQNPIDSLFFVSKSRLDKLSYDQIEEFHQNLSQIVVEEINPAFESLVEFLSGDYRQTAPDAVGYSQYPAGKEFYHYLVKYHTNLSISPEEVHKIGLKEVERVNAQMRKIQKEIGVQGTLNEFFKAVKKDPQFYAKSPSEIGERFMGFIDEIEPQISSYFKKLPKAPYGAKRLDPRLEASMSYGYYEAPSPSEPEGIYYYNGSNLDQQFLINLAGLIYHELIPGHHFQIALQLEAEHLPDAQKWLWTTAYVEGWADYASVLAQEMGMYSNPYDLYGRLLMDKFVAVRLVVDTGMNYFGWSREKAVEYMKENQFLATEDQILSESLRYSVDLPGQALAYRMGSIKFWELREKVERALGERFDIQKLHEAMIGYGSMPLSVLEWHIDNFIEKELGSK